MPVLIVVIEIFFFRGSQPREAARLAHRVLGLAIAAAALIGIVIAISSPNFIIFDYGYRPFTLWERVHTGLANLYVNQGSLEQALQHLERAAARPGVAELGLALHAISAHCLANRPPPPCA